MSDIVIPIIPLWGVICYVIGIVIGRWQMRNEYERSRGPR